MPVFDPKATVGIASQSGRQRLLLSRSTSSKLSVSCPDPFGFQAIVCVERGLPQATLVGYFCGFVVTAASRVERLILLDTLEHT